jgi:hypothetical protein
MKCFACSNKSCGLANLPDRIIGYSPLISLAMSGHCKMILETDCVGKIAINPDKFDKLITSLRTAVHNYGTLDKEATSYNDIFDAFRLALKFYHYEDSSSECD